MGYPHKHKFEMLSTILKTRLILEEVESILESLFVNNQS